MRTIAGVGLVIVCLGLAGCGTLGRKKAGTDPTPRPSDGGAPAARADLNPEPPGPPPNANGILAGQVVDGFNRRTPKVLIQVVDLQDAKQPAAARIEAEANDQGYFVIQGLQPGRHYQLIARVQEGGRLLSGSALVMPPNPRLSIVVNEDNTSSGTPPLPSAPALPDKRGGKPSGGGPAAAIEAPRPDGDGPVETVPLPPIDARGAPAPRPPQPDPTKIVGPSGVDPSKPPPVNIQSPKSPPPASDDPLFPTIRPRIGPNPVPPPSPTGAAAPGTPPAFVPVPSCVLTGKQLVDFAVYDLDGDTWQYKRDRRGRFTLLHFWHTSCPPCLATVTKLVPLQKEFGHAGLEVVGIAYEQGEFKQQVANVRSIRGRFGINYTTLLGGPQESCPLLAQFDARQHPTLVLLDDNGQIVWRGVGYDERLLAELRLEVQKLAANRPR